MISDLFQVAPGDLVRVVRHGATCWDASPFRLLASTPVRVPGGTPGLVIELASEQSTGMGPSLVRAVFGALGPRWIRRDSILLVAPVLPPLFS